MKCSLFRLRSFQFKSMIPWIIQRKKYSSKRFVPRFAFKCCDILAPQNNRRIKLWKIYERMEMLLKWTVVRNQIRFQSSFKLIIQWKWCIPVYDTAVRYKASPCKLINTPIKLHKRKLRYALLLMNR